MPNKTKNKKKITLPIIIGLVVIFAVAISVGIWFTMRETETIGEESIHISSSIAKSIYRGGSGRLEAKRSNIDGSVDIPVNDVTFTSSHPQILSFNGEGTTKTNPCAFSITNDEKAFADTFKYGDSVIVTVVCGNLYDDIHIKITDATEWTVVFDYPDADNIGQWKKQPITVYEGYTVEQSGVEEPDLSAWENFDCRWIIGDTDEEYDTAKPYVWHDDIEVKAKLSGKITLKDELNNSTIADYGNVVVGQSFNIDSSRSGLNKGDTKDGWRFDGWYPNINSNELENGVKDGEFFSVSDTLYAKWTSEIKFEVSLAEGATESLGTPKIDNIVIGNLPVVYGGKLDVLPYVDYTYPTKISATTWMTDEYGAGNPISDYIQDGNYIGKAEQKYYNRTEIVIDFHDDLTNSTVSRSVVYGAHFVEDFPRFEKKGWIMESSWNVANIGEVSEQYIKEEYKYNLNRTTTCEAIWYVTIQYNADIGKISGVYGENNKTYTVRYDEILNLDTPSSGNGSSWAFSGWYDNVELSGDAIGRVNTASHDFIELVDRNVRLIDGEYRLPLYTKWCSDVTLDYKNGRTSKVLVTYGTEIGNKLPTNNPDVIGDPPEGYEYAIGNEYWKTEEGIPIASNTVEFPLHMDKLIYQWKGLEYTVVLDHNNPGVGAINGAYGEPITATYGEKLVNKTNYVPTTDEHMFGGYYYKNPDNLYYNANMIGCRPWDIIPINGSSVILSALWVSSQCVVILDPVIPYNQGYNDKNGTDKIGVGLNHAMPNGYTAPTRAGYTFKGYYDNKDYTGTPYYDANMNGKRNWEKNVKTATLYAKWEANPITAKANVPKFEKIPIGDTHRSDVEVWNGSGNYNYEITSSSHPGVDANLGCDGLLYRLGVKSKNKDCSGTVKIKVTDNRTGQTASCQVTYSTEQSPCVVPGTLITLADRSQKPVEKLIGDEMLLVWNIYTGKFDVAPILFIDSDDETTYEIINLYFSDGTTVKVISEHGFWDYNLNEWVFLRDDAAQYIGHWFNKQSTDSQGDLVNIRVQLTNVVITEEITSAWSPVTFGHLCYYVNGMLSMPGATEGFINIFEVNPETMKVDEAQMTADIEKYGLFTYEDFAEYIPEEVFYAFNGQYLKVAMGKGLLTWDDIYALIDRYQKFWQQI